MNNSPSRLNVTSVSVENSTKIGSDEMLGTPSKHRINKTARIKVTKSDSRLLIIILGAQYDFFHLFPNNFRYNVPIPYDHLFRLDYKSHYKHNVSIRKRFLKMEFGTLNATSQSTERAPKNSLKNKWITGLVYPEFPRGFSGYAFECFALRPLKATKTKTADLLRCGLNQLHRMMHRAVERGESRRSLAGIRQIRMDEKALKRGHTYATMMRDSDRGLVIDVGLGRTRKAP